MLNEANTRPVHFENTHAFVQTQSNFRRLTGLVILLQRETQGWLGVALLASLVQ